MEPIVFAPYFRPRVWGGRGLAEMLHKDLPPHGVFGESWEISSHPHHVSTVAEGPLAGMPLDRLWREQRAALAGAECADDQFPLLIKWLDCHDLLSVQVHPDDAAARRLRGEARGKTEAWVVWKAAPTARIYAGLKPGTTREELLRRLQSGDLADCWHQFQPRAGDCVFLPAGTVHAVGGGVLMAEIQQSSDITFRLFDWNRRLPDGGQRELHHREALEAIDWSAGPVAPRRPEPVPRLPSQVHGERLVRCPYFTLERYRLADSWQSPYFGSMSIWLLLEGLATLSASAIGYRRVLKPGETVLIPAASPPATWTPAQGHTTLLLAVVQP